MRGTCAAAGTRRGAIPILWLPTLLLVAALGGCFGSPPGADDTVRELDEAPEELGDTGAGDDGRPVLRLEPMLSGLERPVAFASVADASDRLLVVEQVGRAREWNVTSGETEIVLDVRDRVSSGGERGLLAVALPPVPRPDHLLLHYTDRDGDTVVSAVARAGAAPDVQGFDAGTEHVLLRVDQPYSNHNGGGMVFGPDGMLYLALGDGGAGGDPHGHGQDPQTLLGSILRLSVPERWADLASGYEVPADNPFVGSDAGRDEVWSYGLRNPWRISFDAATGDLWIADVGQSSVEEVNRQPAASDGGENHGWNVWEGNERFRPGEARGELVFPVAAYALEDGRCAIIGGLVLRGDTIPGLDGTYVFGDHCTGEILGLRQRADETWSMFLLMDSDIRPTAFGAGSDGALYVADHGGTVQRVVVVDTGGT